MKKIIIFITVAVILIGGIFVGYKMKKPEYTPVNGQTEELSYEGFSSLTQSYTHPKYNFYFKHPEDFNVVSVNTETGELLTVQNAQGVGFQMRIQEIDEDVREINTEMIKNDLPDLEITNPQDVLVGVNGKGVAFISDDPLFAGNSREIWFVHNKVFYQISTFAKYDALMKDIFSTWEFR